MRPIDEQVVLVTGATGGLGRALAQRLAELGAQVMLTRDLAAELDGVSGRFFDGTREAEPHAAVDDPVAREGLRALTDELLARART